MIKKWLHQVNNHPGDNYRELRGGVGNFAIRCYEPQMKQLSDFPPQTIVGKTPPYARLQTGFTKGPLGDVKRQVNQKHKTPKRSPGKICPRWYH